MTPANRPTALYGPQMAGDTSELYERLRREHGPVAPVELEPGVPAWLVLGYRELLEVTRNEECFSHDPRRWRALHEGLVRPDSALLPFMGYRPTMLFADGPVHRRFSRAIADGLGRNDLHRLRRGVAQLANSVIDRMARRGQVDLMAEYAEPLPLWVACQVLDLPDHLAPQLLAAIDALVDSSPEAVAGNQTLQRILTELLREKTEHPGDDLTSFLLAHPAELTAEEIMHHLLIIILAGTGPITNWIANTTLLLLTDTRFRNSVTGGRLTVDAALDEVLWRDPPTHNFPGRYATRDLQLGGQFIRAGDALVLGLAAANRDPAVQPPDGQIIPGNRSHLAFSAGPHTCPGRDPARVITHTAVDTLLHRLPDLRLGVLPGELTYRPSPWTRALEALPVTFTPDRPHGPTSTPPTPTAAGGPAWTPGTRPHSSASM